jgi:HlyD family secretion protein
MTRRGKIIAGLLLLGIGGAAFWQLRPSTPPPASPAPAAATGPIGVGALGRIEPASRIRRLNQPGGMAVTRLDRLLVAEGAEVAQGQLLAEFADTAMKDAAAAQGEAAVAEAEAQLARLRAAGRPSEIEAQRARIEAITAQEEIALRDAARAERLVPTGAGAAATADRSRAIAIRLAAEKREAMAALDTLLSSRPEDIALAEARLAGVRAAAAKAQADAELARVRAPIAGTILRIFVRPGDQVGADGVLEMADLSKLEVVADVYETDLPRVRLGAAAEVVVPGEAQRFAAQVNAIGWTVRRQTQASNDPVAAVDARTVEVRLTLDEAGAAALRRRSNMQVQVAIRP